MRILYATDGSEGGLTPARFLASLPHQQNIHVHIVTVLDHDDEGSGSAVLEAAQAALGAFAGQVTTATARGNSTSEIADVLLLAADAVEADLITVGASGHSAIARFFIGSVAESIARYAEYPVLLTRPLTSPLHEVIVGVDGSDCGQEALEFVASRFPLPPDCTLRLVSIVPQVIFGGVVGEPMYFGADYLALDEGNREAKKKAIESAEAIATGLRSADASFRIEVEPVVMGSPGAELVRIAGQHSAGLIVVGSQGLTGLDKLLLGSVSQSVLHHARCSVLIVKKRPDVSDGITHTL